MKKIFSLGILFLQGLVFLQASVLWAAPVKIAIIGAGLSGLSAAYELKKLKQKQGTSTDFEVTVWEARNREGGRVWTVKFKDQKSGEETYDELGGTNLLDGGDGKEIIELTQELGLTTIPRKFASKPYFIDPATKEVVPVYEDERTQLLLGDSHEKMQEKTPGKSPETEGAPGKTPQKTKTTESAEVLLENIEKESKNMSEVIDKYFDKTFDGEPHPYLKRYLDQKMKIYEGGETQSLSPTYARTTFLWFLERTAESTEKFIKNREIGAFEVKTIKGGNGLLPQRLAQQIGAGIHYQMVLKEIRMNRAQTKKSKFNLFFDNRMKKTETIDADYVILTVPLSVLKKIKIADGVIPADQWQDISKVQYSKHAKILFPLDTKELNFTMSGRALTWLNQDQRVLTFYYVGDSALMPNISKALTNGLDRDLNDIRRIYQNITPTMGKNVEIPQDRQFNEYETPVGWSWALDPYARGGYSYVSAEQKVVLNKTETSFGETIIHAFRPIQNRIFLAGEATTTGDLRGTMEGAVRSGKRAARMVIRALSPENSIQKSQ